MTISLFQKKDAGVFSKIKETLLTPDFISFFSEKTRTREIRLYKKNPELKKLVAEKTCVDIEVVEKHWDEIYQLLLKIHSGQIKPKNPTQASVRFNTLATIMYYALYEKYGVAASEHMYAILEPIMVSAINGDEKALEKARLFFLPVSENNIDDVIKLLKEIVSQHKNVFCESTVLGVLRLICAKSSYLPASKGRSGAIKDTSYCERLFSKHVLRGVCTA